MTFEILENSQRKIKKYCSKNRLYATINADLKVFSQNAKIVLALFVITAILVSMNNINDNLITNNQNKESKMFKMVITRNTKWFYDSCNHNSYCIEGKVLEGTQKHAEFRFNFVRGEQYPTFVTRTRYNFNKRFSSKNQRVFKMCELYADINDTNKIIEIILNYVYTSHDMQIERERQNEN